MQAPLSKKIRDILRNRKNAHDLMVGVMSSDRMEISEIKVGMKRYKLIPVGSFTRGKK